MNISSRDGIVAKIELFPAFDIRPIPICWKGRTVLPIMLRDNICRYAFYTNPLPLIIGKTSCKVTTHETLLDISSLIHDER